MSYPQRSDWTSGVPLSAWYAENVAGRDVRACQTSGWSFLRDLQEVLKTRLAERPLPTLDGSVVNGSEIQVNELGPTPDSPWSIPLLRALYAVAAADRAPTAYLQAIASDIAANSHVSAPTLQTALWVTYLNEGQDSQGNSRYGLGSPAEAMVRQDSILPILGIAPMRPPGGVVSSGLSCFVAPDALRPVADPTWKSFITNPWVILGLATVGIGGIMVAMNRIPRSHPKKTA